MKIQNVPTGYEPAHIEQKDNHFMNELLSGFIKNDNEAALIYIVRRHRIDVNALRPIMGKTLLGLAVEALSHKSVRALLEEKADPCLRDGFGFSPMMYLIKQDVSNEKAAEQMSVLKDIFRDLIAFGAQPKTAGYKSSHVLEASPLKKGFLSEEVQRFLAEKERGMILR